MPKTAGHADQTSETRCVLVMLGSDAWPFVLAGGGPEGCVETGESTVSNSNLAEFVIAVCLVG